MVERLTTLAAVKSWLGQGDSTSGDETLTRLIVAASRLALNYMNRDSISAQVYTENCRGNGKDRMLLRNWPVSSITSVGIAGNSIVASTRGNAGFPSTGWLLSDHREGPQSVELYGYAFYYRAPCQVVYRAGYETSESFELEEVEGKIEVMPSRGGQWVKDEGVTIDAVTAALVKEDPAAGEYAVSEWGVYTFNVADAGKVAVISYGYSPEDISQAVLEMVSEWYKRKDRIGVNSKSLSGGVGESVSYSQSDMNDAARSMLQPYRNVVPI